MATHILHSEAEPVCDMNTTPLIDVMLVLLIMFILTIPVMTHAVKLEMPSTRHPPQVLPPPEVIELDVEFDGRIVWNGTVVPNERLLEAYLRAVANKDPQPEIHLRPDAHVKYDAVAKVLAAAQRNHMRKIGFINIGQFHD